MTVPVRCLGAGLTLTVLLSGALTAVPQQARPDEAFLVVVMLKAQVRLDRTAVDLEKLDKQLQENDAAIKDADRRLSIARETNNAQAELEPENDLQTARSARGKLKKARSRLEAERSGAESLFAAAKQALTGPRGSESVWLGAVSSGSGNTVILKKDGKKVALKRGQTGFLEAGDEVLSGNDDGDVVELLDGRGEAFLGAKSRLKAEGGTSQGQAWFLLKGKASVLVDGAADIESLLRKSPGPPEGTLDAVLKKYGGLDAAEIGRFFGTEMKLAIPGAVCSTKGRRFAVRVVNEGTAEVVALDGAVEVGNTEGTNRVLVEPDSTAVVTKGVIAEPRKAASSEKWWERSGRPA